MGKGTRKAPKKGKDLQQAARKESVSSQTPRESVARRDQAKPKSAETETTTPPASDGDDDARVNSSLPGEHSDSSASTIPPATATTMDGAQPDVPDRETASEIPPNTTAGNAGESASHNMSAPQNIDELRQENAALRQDNAALERKNADLQQQCDMTWEGATQLQIDNAELEQKCRTAKDAIFHKDGTIIELKHELDINRKELAEANSARLKLEKERNEWQEKYDARSERFNDLETYGHNANEEFRQEKKRNEQLSRDYDEREAENAAQREELQLLQERVQQAEEKAGDTEQYAIAFEHITAELQPILDDAGLDATADSIISLMMSMNDSAKLKRTSSDASMGSDISVRKPRPTNGKRQASLGDELRIYQRKDSGHDNDSEDNNLDPDDPHDETHDLFFETTPTPKASTSSELQAERAKTMAGFHLPAHSQRDQELGKLREEVWQRDQELGKLKDEVWQLEKELGKLKDEVWQLIHERDELQTKLTKMTVDYDEANANRFFLAEQISEREKELKETKDKLNARNDQNLLLEQELSRPSHGRSLSIRGELEFEKKAREDAEQKLAEASAAAQQSVYRVSVHDQAPMACWRKVLWVISFFFLLCLKYMAYKEAKMWYDANDVSLDVHPYAQRDGSSAITYSSKYANNGWVRWVEDDILGISHQLYG